MMKAVWNNKVLAASEDVVNIEGVWYFPVSSLKARFFRKSPTRSRCPWKGLAHYLTIEINGQVNEDAAWYYPEPEDCNEIVKNRIAFWKGVCVVSNEKITQKLERVKGKLV